MTNNVISAIIRSTETKTAIRWMAAILLVFSCMNFGWTASADDPTPTPTFCVPEWVWLVRHLPESVMQETAFNVTFSYQGGSAYIIQVTETVPEGFEILSPAWDAHTGNTYTWYHGIMSYQAIAHTSSGGCFYGGTISDHWCNGETSHTIDGDSCLTVANPTSTPPPSITPTPTCPPCIPTIAASFSSIDDTVGDCSDGDQHMDAGEKIDLEILFRNDVCTMTNCSADISIDNENVTILSQTHFELGTVDPYQNYFEVVQLEIDPSAACREAVIFTIETTGMFCGHSYDNINTIGYYLELDYDGAEWVCDIMPCGNTSPTPDPTSTPAVSPTATCPPCAPLIIADFIDIEDDQGACTDNDDRMDAGEDVLITIRFENNGSCAGTLCHAEISVDNPHVQVYPAQFDLGTIGMQNPVDRTIIVSIDPETACMEPVTFTIASSGYFCDSSWPYDSVIEYVLEGDDLGGNMECDNSECGGPTWTPTPAPTPAGAAMELIMDDMALSAGDSFRLQFNLRNPGASAISADVWIILDIMGNYWFYPSWSSIYSGYDYKPEVSADAGAVYNEIVLDFAWPAEAGNASGLFYGAAFEPGTFNLVGTIQTIAWTCE